MNTLTRREPMWEPMCEMQIMRSMMDRFFDEPFLATPQLQSQRGESFPVPLDVIEEEGEYIVKASMPGVNPDETEITLTDNVLTIKGESKSESETKESNYHVRERHYGSFVRHITLPMPVESDKVDAIFEHGVLTLHLPKTEAAKPKKITVKPTVVGEASNGHNGAS